MRSRDFSGQMTLAASRYGKERDYWLNKLSGEPVKTGFPSDHSNTGCKREVKHITFRGRLFDRLMKVSKSSDYMLHMILDAAVVALLGRYTSNRDIIVGMPIYKQPSEEEFLNTALALRHQLEDHMSFKELLLRVRQTVIEADQHQNYPLETLLYQLNMKFTGSDFPLFDVAVLLENIHHKKYIEHTHPNVIFSFLRTDNRIEGTVEYNLFLYYNETIERMIRHFTRLLEQAVFNVEMPLGEIDILSEEEKRQLLWDFNRTDTRYPRDKTIDELFQEQAEKTPGKTAVTDERESLTYEALNEWSHRLAVYLQCKGLRHEEAVGIMAENNVKMIVGILGILKAGGAYLPLNSEYPEERIKYLLGDGNVQKLLITTDDDNEHTINRNNIQGTGLIHPGNWDIYPLQDNLKRNHSSQSLAYIIYTSGSTGNPKGAMVEHKSVVRLVKNTDYVEFREGDRILQTGALDFDASTFEIWGALLNGLQLVLAGKEAILTPDTLKALIRKNEITTIWMTSPLFNQMLDEDIEIFKGLGSLLVGGDVLSPAHINRVRDAFPGLKVINGYGPTENTTFSTVHLIEQEYKQGIPIGKPIANSTAYILDSRGGPVPVGVPGELCVGGDGLARGYLNNPELTEEKFVEYRSYRTYISKKLYRTGDLTRWLPDGNIEFLGRIDHQVKIRGYRIEPGEIETQLGKMKEIDEAVVVVRGSGPGKYLCAYVVSRGGEELDVMELKRALSGNLPDYMIPAYFVRVEKIPLTANGKVDKEALPEPEVQTEANYAAPRDDLENGLVRIWSRVLGVEKDIIGIDTDFFNLGGHSLKATLLIAGVHKELEVKIPLAELFKAPTIREMAAYIKTVKKDKFSAVESVEKKEYYELSSVQKRLYVLQQMKLDGTGYNIPLALALEGELNAGKLEQTFRQLIRRHESGRTSFEMINERPVQRIHNNVEFEIKYYDSAAENTLPTDFIRPFDLSCAPLMRIGLIKTGEKKHILTIDIHHIITDGTSMGILVNEFMKLYGGEELPRLRIQYKDFSRWQNQSFLSGGLKSRETYWIRQFEPAGDIPVMNLPLDYPRPGVYCFEGDRIVFKTGSAAAKALNRLAREQGVTLFMVLAGIFAVLLAKLSRHGDEDILMGTPVSGRRHADLHRVMGMFVNTLVLRHSPVGQSTFTEFLDQVKKKTLEAFENQDYPFELLVDRIPLRRDTGRNPLFDVMFVLQNMEYPGLEIPGLKLTPVKKDTGIAKFDLTLIGTETGDNLVLAFEYSTNLFMKETVLRFANYFKQIISAVVTDPGKKICRLEMLPEEEKASVLFDFNHTAAEYPRDTTIRQLFEEQVERTPESVGIVGSRQGVGQHLTYRELNRKSNQLAHVLKEKGVLPDNIVGIMMERSIDMIIGILGILKVGGAYLPIDVDYPQERIDYMLKDSGAKILLTNLPEGRLIHHSSNQFITHHSGNIAYVIYTSGSTGRPKGVLIHHRGVVNMVWSHRRVFEEHAGSFISQVASPAFDAMAFEVWPCLLAGACLCIVDDETQMEPRRLKEWLIRHQVTISFQPTGIALELLDEPWPQSGVALKVLRTAGDRLTRYPGRSYPFRFFNLYGPTEATVWSTWTEVEAETGSAKDGYPPIGKPIDNHRIYILSPDFELRPIGVAGELCIAGAGLARGYLNRPELTNEKLLRGVQGGSFLEKSPPGRRRQKIYRTGDLARWLPDGNLEFLGRLDHQVKIRGYRIELGEIQSRLETHEGIKEAIVIDRETEAGKKHVCAYIIPESPSAGSLKTHGLREFLSRSLPDYMIPAYFTVIDKIPLTSNGKVDRNALPVPGIDGPAENYLPPRDGVERKLVDIWSAALGIEKEMIGIAANFFELGGHSLKAVAAVSGMRKEFNMDVPLVEVFRRPFIKSLAEFIRKAGANPMIEPVTPGDDHLVLLKKTSSKAGDFFFIHDGTGEVDGYIECCNCLTGEFNFWGIRAPKIANDPPQNLSIEEIARNYIHKIKSLQSRGPYFIAGWSIGGTIAFEMVLQLERMEEESGFLALIDTPPPGKLENISHGQRVWPKVPGYCLNMVRTLNKARDRYIPGGKIDTQVHFFKAGGGTKAVDAEKWNLYCRDSIRWYEIPGDHFSIMKMPEVASLAKLFDKIVRRTTE
ncbi:MAG: amino acid adenylation domain-containing protein [Candidatus Aminicenantes bacterium]|nr:amino acid adenylation domain-containing protein [Candidatus Aminicenantes bacterium]NIQ73477.1 amino acid adenylation domain-containing protein [Candidatus Aminicenantes bacterium]NIT29546.1 amino acid adenylation domain-containing protein [Candidatus Aminicenantes bacterium]